MRALVALLLLANLLFLALAQGWRFSGHVVEPMRGHHGAFSCLMERGE